MKNRIKLNTALQIKQSEGFRVVSIGTRRVYVINDSGKVFSISVKAGKVKELKQSYNDGYYSVGISGKPIYVHVLVAQAFICNKPSNNVVNHKDGNKSNNNVSNLEFVTQSVNTIHGHMLGKVNIYDRAIEIIESGYEGFTGKTDFCWNNGLGLSYGTCWNICADVEKYKERITLMEKYGR